MFVAQSSCRQLNSHVFHQLQLPTPVPYKAHYTKPSKPVQMQISSCQDQQSLRRREVCELYKRQKADGITRPACFSSSKGWGKKYS